MNNIPLSDMRINYTLSTLSEYDLLKNPISQFEMWFNESILAGVSEPNAMILCTNDKDGFPDGRTVLLKDFNQEGFAFYTNYSSHKSNQLESNPACSLVFLWKEIQRQVRIRGLASRMSREEAQIYFSSRPRESQIGAWASPQSEVLQDREQLEQLFKSYEMKFANQQEIPLPPHWGGYRIKPNSIEFWQGRSGRLHDRFLYLSESGNWSVNRLAP